MFLMYFLISFNYNALRSYKDTMVVTASHSGAAALPFIKVWAVFPAAILMTLLFTRLASSFSREKVFYIMMSLFLSFFFLFAFVLYPAQDLLHPHQFADRLQTLLPSGFQGFIAIFRNWTFTLFYVMSELWSTAIFTVLFWGFANEVTNVQQAKRFYGLISTGGNLAGVFAGQAAIFFSGNLFASWIPYGKTAWDQSILFLTLAIVVCGLLTMAIFRWLNVHVIRPQEESVPLHERPEKTKLSLRQTIQYLSKSKYLICIALIVIAYNLTINLVEIVWKNQINVLYPHPSDYNAFMGKVMTCMGIIATISGLFTTSNFLRRFSWTTCAMIPLVIVGLTGSIFFTTVLLQQNGASWIASLFGVTPLLLSVTLGAIQNCLSRASKYTIFDATKEIAFIPLSLSTKLKGKAAIDGIGSRLGKSGGSIAHQGLLLIFSTVASSSPYVAIIFIAVLFVWGFSVLSLGKQFDALTVQNAKLDVPDTSSNLQPALTKS